ncbi:MAG: hypothetical protein NT040_11200 [Bacteroidetes bacterium]|nr:hypothetical protein [Bacteroidota bacterium]
MEAIENILTNRSFDSLTAERRFIFKEFRKIDCSSKWLINAKFNVTERAIQRFRRYEQQHGLIDGVDVISWLNAEILRIIKEAQA